MGADTITVGLHGSQWGSDQTGAVKREGSGWAEIWKQNWQDLVWTA